VAETTSLLRKRRGNSSEGSNPSRSAIFHTSSAGISSARQTGEHVDTTTQGSTDHQCFMGLALAEARAAAAADEVPVGAVVVCDGRVIATSRNAKESSQNPCAHAEILALQAASQALGRWRLMDCTLYVTLEPCVMCAGACVHSRLGRVVFGAWDPKFGGIQSLYAIVTDPRANHRCDVVAGVEAAEAKRILQAFFRGKRL
jgi:tRNA(Arg) A34 adenosine deaminase TadA